MGKPSEDIKLSILNDHYKETVAGFKQTAKSRDVNFVYMIILVGIMGFQYVSPRQSTSIITQIAHQKLGVVAPLSSSLINALVWFTLLYVTTRYFQALINLEKEYNYTHGLERELSRHYTDKVFTREGKSYLKKYPLYSEWLHVLYRGIFPVSLWLITTVKIYGEWSVKDKGCLPLAVDTALYLALVLSIALSVVSLRQMKKNTEKDV